MKAAIITLAILVIAFFIYQSNSNNRIEEEVAKAQQSIQPKTIALYQDYCASCHGVNLEGQKNWMSRLPDGLMPAPPHDETGHTWHHPDRYLFMVTKYGIEEFIGEKYPNNMPAYKDILSDEEIIAVLSYIKSTWPKKIKEIHNNINSRSKR